MGRPQTIWKEVLRTVLESSDLTLDQAVEEAPDHETWNYIVLVSYDNDATES